MMFLDVLARNVQSRTVVPVRRDVQRRRVLLYCGCNTLLRCDFVDNFRARCSLLHASTVVVTVGTVAGSWKSGSVGIFGWEFSVALVQIGHFGDNNGDIWSGYE